MIGTSSITESHIFDDLQHLYSHFESSQHQDLYELLLNEPKSIKKPSIIYDYTPAATLMLPSKDADSSGISQSLKMTPQSSQTEIHVRKCTCSKTRCQKNYCECFKQGVICSSACQCVSCCNKEKLFSARSSTDGQRCNCQKSKCQKNYCECHLNGRKCGPSCRCLDCQNIDLPEDCLELTVSRGPTKLRKTSNSN